MENTTAQGLRRVADNVDLVADHAERFGRMHEVEKLRNNARFLRRAADHSNHQEIQMGKFADKIHQVEKDRDAALARATAAETQAAQNAQAQVQLDALTAAGKIADDADVAALTDDAGGAPPTPPVTPP